MRRFFALTLIQFRGLLSTTTAGRRRARMWPSAAAWGLLALLLLVMSAAYSFPLVSALGPAHAGLVLLLMPIVGGLATVLLGAQGAGTFVFGGRDNDLLLSLPIPRTTLAAAKIAALLAESVLVMACMMLPAAIAYALATPTGWTFWVGLPLVIVLLGGGLTALALLIGLVVTLLRARRWARSVTNSAAMLLLVGVLAAWVAVQEPLADLLVRDPGLLRATLAAWLPPFGWAQEALLTGAPASWGLLAASTLLPLAVLAWLVGRSFVSLVTGLAAHGGPRRAADLGRLRVRTPFVALVRREAQRFFGTTVFFINTGFGLVIAALGAGYLLVGGGIPGLAEAAAATGTSPAQLLTLALALTLTTVQTTAPSISLEGHRLWILKSAPVSAATVLQAKAAFNVLVAAPVILLGVVAVGLTAAPGPLEVLGVVLVPLAVATLAGTLGLVTNLRWPNLDAPNETVAVKQGLSVVVAMFGAMILAAVAAGLGVAVSRDAGSGVGLLVTALVLFAISGGCYALLRTWGVRAFDALV